MAEAFRIQFTEGVMPGKWLRIWAERMPDSPLEAEPVSEVTQLDGVRDGSVSMGFVRLPVDQDGLHVIPLYREDPVVVVSTEHVIAAFDEVDVADLRDEPLLQHPDLVPAWAARADPVLRSRAASLPPLSAREAIEVAAAGSGIVVVPLSVARLHDRKDVVHRPVRGVEQSQIGLAWRADDDDPRIEVLIGIVRGRTARSSRGDAPDPAPRGGSGNPAPGGGSGNPAPGGGSGRKPARSGGSGQRRRAPATGAAKRRGRR
ncbi:MAG: LysR substrate-binding domain-containing protein [Dermatophilaceae bacterium]